MQNIKFYKFYFGATLAFMLVLPAVAAAQSGVVTLWVNPAEVNPGGSVEFVIGGSRAGVETLKLTLTCPQGITAFSSGTGVDICGIPQSMPPTTTGYTVTLNATASVTTDQIVSASLAALNNSGQVIETAAASVVVKVGTRDDDRDRNRDGDRRAVIARLKAQLTELTRRLFSRGRRHTQFTNFVIASAPSSPTPPATFEIVRKSDSRCYDYGEDGRGRKGTGSFCPPGQHDANATSTIAISTEERYVVRVSASTQLQDRMKRPLTLSAFETGDRVNVYGLVNASGTIDAHIVRNLTKPLERGRESDGSRAQPGASRGSGRTDDRSRPPADALRVTLNTRFDLALRQTAVIIDYQNARFEFSALAVPRCAPDGSCPKSFGTFSLVIPGGYAGDFNLEVGETKNFGGLTISFVSLDGIVGTFHIIRQMSPVAGTPFITLLTPNGGEVWPIGSKQVVRWNAQASASATLKLWLLQVGSSTVASTTKEALHDYDDKELDRSRITERWLIAENLLPSASSYEWNVPRVAPGRRYAVGIVLFDPAAKHRLRDVSDDWFSIVEARGSEKMPTIESITPSAAVFGSNTQLVITGSNFTETANVVRFTGRDGTSYWARNLAAKEGRMLEFGMATIGRCAPNVEVCPEIAVTLPVGVYRVAVENANGVSNEVQFYVTDSDARVLGGKSGPGKGDLKETFFGGGNATATDTRLSIENINPALGPVGTSVMIKGSGLGADALIYMGGQLGASGCVAPSKAVENLLSFVVPSELSPCVVSGLRASGGEVVPGNYRITVVRGGGVSNFLYFYVTGAGRRIPPDRTDYRVGY